MCTVWYHSGTCAVRYDTLAAGKWCKNKPTNPTGPYSHVYWLRIRLRPREHTCKHRQPKTMRLKAKVAPTYGTPFTHESEPWGARTLLSVQPRHPDIAAAAEDGCTISNKTSADARAKEGSPLGVPLKVPLKVSVVSYNVLADSNSVRVRNCRPSVLNWGRRREILLREIFSVR